MTNRQLGRALLFAFVVWVAARSEAQQYNLTPLGVGSPTDVYYSYTTPKINNKGQVVGNRAAGGYLFSGGALSTLPMTALDINNNGTIAMSSGGFSFLSFPPYATQTSMGTLPSCLLGDTEATSLNDSGVAVGVADAPTTCPLPFSSSNGQMTAIGASQPEARWMAINNSNQVVGYWQDSTSPNSIRAVQLINGTLTDLDPSADNLYDSAAIAINNAGQFVVNSNETYCTKRLGPPSFKTFTYPCRGLIWYPLLYNGGTITNMGGLGTAGGSASAINLWGDVVGVSQTSSGSSHGFLYTAGSMTDLNSHLTFSALGWTIQQAYDINDFGQIVALATNLSGNSDVVVLSPVAVTPPTISNLTLNPTTVLGGIAGRNTSTGTVTLSSAAPAGGTVIFLGSNNAVAQVPSMIRVAAGSTTATFTVTTSTLVLSVNVTISATTGTSTKTATLMVTDVGS